MTQTSPFTPDDQYCVYCHAVAAGVCAACGALCCGECVELVMGLTTQRAMCHDCLQKGNRPGDVVLWKWLVAALAAVAIAAAITTALTALWIV